MLEEDELLKAVSGGLVDVDVDKGDISIESESEFVWLNGFAGVAGCIVISGGAGALLLCLGVCRKLGISFLLLESNICIGVFSGGWRLKERW